MKKSFLFVLTLCLSCLMGWAAPSNLPTMIPSTGKDFWLTFMQNAETSPSLLRVYVVTGAESANVSIFNAAGSPLISNHPVAANSNYSYDVAPSQAYVTSSGVVVAKGLHVTATADVAVYMVNAYKVPGDISYDASPVLATSALGTEYVAQTYYADMKATEFAVVGTAASTNVRIILNHEAINDGGAPFAANETINVVLNAGEVYQLKGAADVNGINFLSGTTVMGDKPIAVFSGGVRATIPFDDGANGDHIFEQAIPISAWGKKFILTEFHGFSGSAYTSLPTEYSITAIYDNTKVYVDGVLAFTLQKGQTSSDAAPLLGHEGAAITVDHNQSPKFVETSEPVLCYGYMTNGTNNKTSGAIPALRKTVGEPSMILIPSTRQGLMRSDFTTYDGATAHYVNVVVPAWAKSAMRLNGSNVGSSFTNLTQQFSGDTAKYAYARLALANGHNTLSNASAPFLSFAYGVTEGTAESYAYATSFNLAPEAPKVFIDNQLMAHKDVIDYCNRHPGIRFKGVVDYPHDNVVWEFGDGASSTTMTSQHMYGFSIGEETRTNIVNFIVTRHDPLSNIEHKDTVQVTLNVHPTYYDTLKVDVCGDELSYTWTEPSAEWIAAHGATTLTGTDILGKTAASKVYSFTANTNKEIFDSLYFKTRANDCDSIFYLRLRIHPQPTVTISDIAEVCYPNASVTVNYSSTNAAKYSYQLLDAGSVVKASATDVAIGSSFDINTSSLAAGTYTLKMTVKSAYDCVSEEQSKTIVINPKPTVAISPIAAVCYPTASVTVNYISTDAAKYSYQLLDAGSVVKASATDVAIGTSFNINTSSLAAGTYTLKMTVKSNKNCVSDEATATLTINPKPTITISPIDVACYPVSSVTVNYASTDAVKYSYRLYNSSNVQILTVSDQPIGTSFDVNTYSLVAGLYTLKVTVTSAEGCVSDEVSASFRIYPYPMASINPIADVCGGTPSTTVTYTTFAGATYSYSLRNSSNIEVASVTDLPCTGSFSISTASLPADTYKLHMTVKSSVGCESAEYVETMVVNVQPTVTLDPIAPICQGDAVATVSYHTTDAAKYSYQVLDASSAVVASAANQPALADGTFDINTTSFANGTYTVKMTATSALGCNSLEATSTFSVSIQPTITLTPLAAICEKTASVTVNYATTDASTYSYTLKNASSVTVASATDQSASASGNFTITTGTLSAGDYTLTVKAKSSAGCESVEKSTTLTIHPQPTVTISPIAAVCYPAASVTVNYTSTNAAKYSYQLLDAGSVVKASATDAAIGTSFNINTSSLSAGTYTLKMTVKSAYDCVSEEGSTTFIINEQPTLTLSPVSDICFGTASVTVNYTSTFASTYDYKVVNASNVVVAHAENQPASASGSFNFASSTLPAGAYIIKVTAKSAADCGSAETTTNLTINPKPTIAITPLEAICESTASITVSYTTTNAATYSYQLVNSSSTVVASATDQSASVNGSFSLSTSGLSDGTYTLKMTATSAHACVSDEATTSLTVNNQPTVSLSPIAAICQGDASVTVSYTTNDASKYSYQVLNASSSVVASATDQSASASGSFDINTASFANGTYTVKMTAVSALGCRSEEATTTFSISIQPTINVTPLAAICEKTASVTVNYATTDASTYSYTLKNASSVTVASATDQSASASGNFTIATGTLSAGDYTLTVKAKSSVGCESVEKSTTLTIHPQPTVTISLIAAVCYPAASVTVNYTSTNAAKYSYQLLDAGSVVKASATDAAIGTSFNINTSSLAAGTYTLKMTVKSAYDCVSEEASTTFIINEQPTLTLSPVSDICFGTASVTVNYTSTFASTYDYKVVNASNVVVAHAENQPASASGSFNFASSTLPAGAYIIKVTAKSAADCGSAETTTNLTINPKPTIAITPLEAICESTASITVSYTTTNAATYSYQLVNSSSVVVASATDQSASVNGSFSLSTSGLSDGTYTLKMTATSAHSCVSDEATTSLTVNNQPTVSLSPIAAICQGDASVTVSYTTNDASKYSYQVLNASSSVVASTTDQSASASGSFDINTASFANGTYTVKMTAVSALGCRSEEATTTFSISIQPTINVTPLAAICEKTASVTVNYATTDASTYSYTLKNASSVTVASATDQSASASGNFTITTGTLSAGDYTLAVKAKSSVGCESVEKSTTLTIHPQPTITLSPIAAVCFGAPTTEVNYTSTDAVKYSYRLLDASNAVVASASNQSASATGTIVLNTASLSVGTYTLKATAASAAPCESDEASVSFNVIDLTPIETTATICNGESYDWEIIHPCTGNPYTLMKNLTASCVEYDTITCPGVACSSVYKLTLTVLSPVAEHYETVSICKGESYSWHGETYNAAGTYTTVVPSLAHPTCDSILHLNLIVSEPTESYATAYICEGESFTFGSRVLTLPGDYHDTIRSGACITAIYHLSLYESEKWGADETVNYCGTSYTWRGKTYYETGVYYDTVQSSHGCDSIMTLNLFLTKPLVINDSRVIRTIDLPYTFAPYPYTYTGAGTYNEVVTSLLTHCDSIIYNLTLTINDEIETILPTHEYATICEGASATWDRTGASFTAAGTYTHIDGDATHYFHLTVNPTYNKQIDVTTCASSYTWHGTPYTTSGTYTWTGTTEGCGCDSTETLHLTLASVSPATNINATICKGEGYPFGGKLLTAAGTYHTTLTNMFGCDSVVNLTLAVLSPVYGLSQSASVCDGDSYLWQGRAYSVAGTYYDTVPSLVSGCDSILTLTLAVKPAYHFEEDVEVLEEALPYDWTGHGQKLTANGDYYDSYVAASGCDSVYHIHFHVNFVTRDTIHLTSATSAAQCDSYTWKGHTYTETGIYSDTVWTNGAHTEYNTIHFLDLEIKHSVTVYSPQIVSCDNEFLYWQCDNYAPVVGLNSLSTTLTAANGCDSVIIAPWRVYESYKAPVENKTICFGEVENWRGHSFSGLAAGSYTFADTLSRVTGCDSIFTLNLTVTPRTAPDTTTYTMCNLASYDWQGYHIANKEPGVYEYYKYYTPSGECETYHMLELTVNSVEPDTTFASVCYGEPYDWYVEGNLVQRGIYVAGYQYDTIADATCSKVYVLDLKVSPAPKVDEKSDVLCPGASYIWRGHSYTKAGDYVDTIPSLVTGCDSLYYVLHLTDAVVKTVDESVHRCYGETYTWPMNGTTYSASTTADYVIPSLVSGCDSIIYNLHLTIDPAPLAGEESMVVCADSYRWNGMTYTSSGNYVQTLTSSLGCDSTATLHLTLSQSQTFNETAIVKPSELPYTWHEDTYTAAGTYTQNFQNVAGCDSNYVLTLIVSELPVVSSVASICEGESYTWRGNSYTTQNVYTETTTDAIYRLDLTVNKKYNFTDEMHVCAGEAYTWRGNTYTDAANTTHVLALSTIAGCDSIYTLNAIVSPAAATSASMVLCEGEVFNWGHYFEIPAAGVHNYTATFTSVSGCDSTVNLTLTVVGPTLINAQENVTICQNELPYSWKGHTLNAAGIYGDTIPSVINGCDSILSSIKLTVNPSFYEYHDVEVRDTEEDLPYHWNGHGLTISQEGTYFDSLLTMNGCDSVYELHFHLNFYDRDTLFLTEDNASAVCGEYTWARNGLTYTTSGLYTDTTKTTTPMQIHYLALDIKPIAYGPTVEVTECGSSYTWNGQTYTASGTYPLTLAGAAVNGCDSLVTLNLTLYPVYTLTDPAQTICADEYIFWQDTVLHTAGTYTRHFTSIHGCDSTISITLHVNDTALVVETAAICDGDTYTWQGMTIAGLAPRATAYPYYKHFTTVNGCDSTRMLKLSVSEIGTYKDTVETIVCEGYESFLWLGHNPVTNALDVPIQDVPEDYTVGTHYITTPNRSAAACADTTFTLKLTVLPIAHSTLRDTICYDETYTWHGAAYAASGTYYDTLVNPVTGCDSVCVLMLTKLPAPVVEPALTVELCKGESYNFQSLGGRHIYTPSSDTILTDTIQSIFSCDSVYTKITITLLDTLPVSDYGKRFDTDPCYVWDASHPSICDPGIYTGSQYYAENAAGCDVRHIVTLQVFHLLEQPLTITNVCAGTSVTVDFFGRDTVITAGVPVTLVDTIDLADPTLVDTIRHMIVTFDNIQFTSDTTVYVLQGTHWSWPNHEWMTPDVTPAEPAVHEANTSMVGTFRYYDVVTCDSIYNLTLNVIQSPSNAEHKTLCSNEVPFTWALYPAHTISSLTAGDTILNDSTQVSFGTSELFWRYDTLYLTVNAISNTVLPDTVVLQNAAFEFCGMAQNTATPHSELLTATLTAANGCDSIVSQNLCVAPFEETIMSICYGESFPWRGTVYTSSTDITETTPNPYGLCDSVFHLELTVAPEPTEYPLELYFSSFLPYSWRGISMTAYDHIYYDTVRTASGCDLEYYSAKVLTKPVILTDTMLCPGASCFWEGMTYTTPASHLDEPFFVQKETATNILALRLSAYETFLDSQDTLIYRGDPTFEWKDEQGSVIESFPTNTHGVFNRQIDLASLVTGCDSIYKLHLVIVGDTLIEKNDTICEGQTAPYVWPEASMSIPMSELTTTSQTYTFHDTVNVRIDSMVVYTLNLFYGSTFYQTDYDTITYTKGHSYTYHDSTYVNLGEGSHVLNGFYLTTAGCDSVYTDSLWVLPHPVVDSIIHIDSVICEGDYIDWKFRGEIVQPDGYHLTGDIYRMATILIESGTVAPDTVYHYSLSLSTEKVDERVDSKQIPFGGSYVWTDLHNNSITLTSDTVVSDTLRYMSGCDSIISHFLLTMDAMSVNKVITDTICQDEFYVWHHDTIATDVPGTYRFNERYQNHLGGDSILTLSLTVVPKGNSHEVVVLSPLDAGVYNWNGHEYHAGMEVTFQLDTVTRYGCDSVASLRVMTGLLSPDTTKVTLCSDEATYHWMRQSVDTIINPAASGLYYAKMPTFVPGIDSVFVLSLKVLPSYTTYTNEIVCAGGLYLNDTIVNDTVRYLSGCDSLYTIRNIHVMQPAELMVSAYDTVPQGSNYQWGDTAISNIQQPVGYYEHLLGPQVFTSMAGCDSTVWMHLYVAPEYHFRDTVKICLGESYYWPRTQQTYTPDRAVFFDYKQSFVSALGMDSVYHLVIAVQPTYNKVENVAVGEGETYRWRSNDYNVAGTYFDHLTSVSGCDSTFQLNLFVGRISKDTITATTCDNVPYEWMVNGQIVGTYTEPGLNFYTMHVSATPAYESILVLDLTRTPSYDYTADIHWPKDSVFTWDQTGMTYPTSSVGTTTYSAPYLTIAGCDSVYNINLVVEPTYFIQLHDTVCEIPGMDMHGIDSVYTEYLETRAGNDSIVEHNLFVHGIAFVDQTDTVCRNDGTMWRGQNISTLDPGLHFLNDKAQTSYGCDSVFQLRYFIYPDYIFIDYDTIPDSEVYGDRWRGIDIPLLTTGNYSFYDSLLTVTGCDSVYQLDLNIRPTYMIEEQKSMCDNDTLNWEGHHFEGVNFVDKVGAGLDAGVYYDTVYFKTMPNYAGQPVDSIRTLVLTVNPIKLTEWVDTICPTDQALVGSLWVSAPGEYWDTISTSLGCDSICHLTLYNFEQYDTTYYDTICYATSYEWQDSIYYYEKGGIYTDQRNFNTIHGCDSIIRLQLVVENLYVAPKRDEACLNDIYHWTYRRPMSFTDSIDIDIEIITPDTVGEVMYIDTILTPLGCEYYDTLYINVVEPVIVLSATADQFCADDIDLVVNYTVDPNQGGEPREYYIYFSEAAHQQGFVDKEAIPMANTGTLLVETMFSKEFFPRPDTYEATLYLSNGSCQDTSAMTAVSFSFDVLYPSWFAEQHWNDVLAVLSPAYNASYYQPEGFEFSAYQWYFNGEPIDGAESSILYYLHNIPQLNHHYDGAPIPAGSYYQVLLTRVDDGKSILTCPLYPEEVKDESTPKDFYFSVNPTFIDRNDPFTNVLSNTTGTYTLFDAAGKRLAVGHVEGCEHEAMKIELPYVPGTYMVTFESDLPSPYTGKILRITYKLLVY